MATRTLNAKTDLTYEEIYEGHANGKSRLPKILKDANTNRQISNAVATLAGTTGVPVIRRRTGGGNASNVSGLGISVTTPVAMLITATRYDALKAGYSPAGGAPSENMIDADVRGVTKNPFDLIDFVSGINNSEQSAGSGDADSTRAAKLKAQGSNSVVRDFTRMIRAADQDLDVRALFGDRIGGGGATGEVHGVDVGIQDLIATDSQAIAIGNTGTGFTIGDTGMQVDLDNQGVEVVTFAAGAQTSVELAAVANPQLTHDPNKPVPMFTYETGQIAIRSQTLGGEVDITEASTELGLGIQTVNGATVGSAGLTGEETVIELDASAVDRLTNIRYGTYQFGTLRVYQSINDASPVAYFVHPDLMDDLVVNNP
jgi:hypothetical protein